MIILDTHSFWWVNFESEKLTPRAMYTIKEASILGVSTISLWELAMLESKRRIKISKPLAVCLEEVFSNPRFKLIDITIPIAVRSGRLPIHGDSGDRLIVATALELSIQLITADEKIRQFDEVQTVW